MSAKTTPDLARRLLVALNDAEAARILALTDKEVWAELAAAGENPGEAAREARERFERLRQRCGLGQYREGDDRG